MNLWNGICTLKKNINDAASALEMHMRTIVDDSISQLRPPHNFLCWCSLASKGLFDNYATSKPFCELILVIKKKFKGDWLRFNIL